MKTMLLGSVFVAMLGYAHATTLEELGEDRCAQDPSSHYCAMYQIQKAKAEQRGRDAVMLQTYVVHYEPVTDVEWHLTNQSVTGWTMGQAPVFTYNEDGARMGIAGHDFFNQRVAIAKDALLAVKAGTFDPSRVETTVGFFSGPGSVTMPTAAIDPRPLICEEGDRESRKVMGYDVLRCRYANDAEWVLDNEDHVREAAINKAIRDSHSLQVNVRAAPNHSGPRPMTYAPTKQPITLPSGRGPRPGSVPDINAGHEDANAILRGMGR